MTKSPLYHHRTLLTLVTILIGLSIVGFSTWLLINQITPLNQTTKSLTLPNQSSAANDQLLITLDRTLTAPSPLTPPLPTVTLNP